MDVTDSAGVNMDGYWKTFRNQHGSGIHTFGSSFTVSTTMLKNSNVTKVGLYLFMYLYEEGFSPIVMNVCMAKHVFFLII